VFCLYGMQTNEVFPVQRENSTGFGNGEDQYHLIRQRWIVSAGIRRSQHIVTKLAKTLDDR